MPDLDLELPLLECPCAERALLSGIGYLGPEVSPAVHELTASGLSLGYLALYSLGSLASHLNPRRSSCAAIMACCRRAWSPKVNRAARAAARRKSGPSGL